ncbi:type II toxin-antitoxin system HicB family antitoxin [Candidatus Kuenenia sp.]|uniref:type II toxin-antitoxin system HicB family antitoxin n=1 Tax=Candidatus Kuenenia sp. TaxID=2499824 RepID=UPI00321FBC31
MIIYWDKADSIYVVEVPELPGCMAHGKSKKEALENAENAVTLWLKTTKEDGIQIPEPKDRLIYV